MTKIIPQSVKGKIRNLKSLLNVVFIFIYLGAPFLRYDRGSDAPNQAILFDFDNSIGYFFGIEMWPDEVYYLMGILIFTALLLFFVTALFGRIWCGYACFQTVWTDIFIGIEKLFQGDRNQRILLNRKNSFNKFYRKFLTHIGWLIVAIITGYGFTAYFSDAFVQFEDLLRFDLTQNVILWIAGIATMTYIMAGFAREAVCSIMCPYARFQSAMFDRDTLIVTYDEKRGERRGRLKDKDRGDCIDCKQCVVVCPTGIDIRDGLQMECIACGLCIDACDGIMDKIGQPRGLIRYDTQSNLENPESTKKPKVFNFLRPRFFFYLTIILTVSSLMLGSVMNKSMVLTSIIAKRNPAFVMMSDGSISNSYSLKITNKSRQDKIFEIKVKQPNFAEVQIGNHTGTKELLVGKSDSNNFRLFIKVPEGELPENSDRGLVIFDLVDRDNGKTHEVEAVFVWE